MAGDATIVPSRPRPDPRIHAAHEAGRLLARPGRMVSMRVPLPGRHPLDLGGRRDGLLFLPGSLDRPRPAPMIVALHGAGGDAEQMVRLLEGAAERHGIVLLALDSREHTWDILLGGFALDVAFADAALERVFDRVAIDPARIAVSGFSDGGSYALSLGLANGTLFSDILAFSPGFVTATEQADHPRIFISHGQADTVLPVERCGRRLAQVLTGAGYDTDYVEFAGGHIVPDTVVDRAVARFLGR